VCFYKKCNFSYFNFYFLDYSGYSIFSIPFRKIEWGNKEERIKDTLDLLLTHQG
jgi:hypothetical protein